MAEFPAPLMSKIMELLRRGMFGVRNTWNALNVLRDDAMTIERGRMQAIISRIWQSSIDNFTNFQGSVEGLTFFNNLEVDQFTFAVKDGIESAHAGINAQLKANHVASLINLTNVAQSIKDLIFDRTAGLSANFSAITGTILNALSITEAALGFKTSTAKTAILNFVRSQSELTRNTIAPLFDTVTSNLTDFLKGIPRLTAEFLFGLFFEDTTA